MNAISQKSRHEHAHASLASDTPVFCNAARHEPARAGGAKSLGCARARPRGNSNFLAVKMEQGGLPVSNPADKVERWLDHFAKTQITISLIAGHFPTEGGTVGREDGFPHGKARFEPW